MKSFAGHRNCLPSRSACAILCDLELLATGGFSPLDRFMGKADYERVLHEMRLSDGVLFPLPITLTADPKELPTVGEELVLRNANNEVMAVMRLDEVYHWDAETKARWPMARPMPSTRWSRKWRAGTRSASAARSRS